MTIGRGDTPASVAGLVLAAGLSSRMGAFKPLLPLGDRFVLAHVVETFRRAGVSEIRVVVGHRADEMIPVVHNLGAVPVVNAGYLDGMFSSIQTGINAISREEFSGCLLLPVDIPLVRSSTVRALMLAWNDGSRPPPPVFYPTFRGRRGHPPLISRETFDEIAGGSGEGGLRAVLARHDARAKMVPVYDEGIRRDMDTPEDYAVLRGLIGSEDVPRPGECEAILDDFQTNGQVVIHSRAVARVAGSIAAGLIKAGGDISPDLVGAGSLLHDIAKGQPEHAATGAALVRRLGFPAIAGIVACHSDLDFDATGLDETAIVFLADKLVQNDRLVPLEERFRPTLQRLASDPEGLAAAMRRFDTARNIARAIEQKTGRSLEDLLPDPCSLTAPDRGSDNTEQ